AGAAHMAETLERTRHLEEVLSTLKDAETGQRGYLLTGLEKYLQPYEAATVALPQELTDTRRLLDSDPRQLERMSALERLAAEKMAELKRTVDMKRADKGDDALRFVLQDVGREHMDQARAIVAQMRDAEQAN